MSVNGTKLQSQCEGKEGFSTMRLARQVALRRRKNSIDGQPYKCQFCPWFHIGSIFGRKKAIRRRRVELDDEVQA